MVVTVDSDPLSSCFNLCDPPASLKQRVETALAQHGLTTEIRQPHLSPPWTRRRAILRAMRVGKGAVLGFNAAKSHRIVDMQENYILRPELIELLPALRGLLSVALQPKRTAEVEMTLVDQGVDLLLKNDARIVGAVLNKVDFTKARLYGLNAFA